MPKPLKKPRPIKSNGVIVKPIFEDTRLLINGYFALHQCHDLMNYLDRWIKWKEHENG